MLAPSVEGGGVKASPSIGIGASLRTQRRLLALLCDRGPGLGGSLGLCSSFPGSVDFEIRESSGKFVVLWVRRGASRVGAHTTTRGFPISRRAPRDNRVGGAVAHLVVGLFPHARLGDFPDPRAFALGSSDDAEIRTSWRRRRTSPASNIGPLSTILCGEHDFALVLRLDRRHARADGIASCDNVRMFDNDVPDLWRGGKATGKIAPPPRACGIIAG